MESAVANLAAPGELVVVASCGKFGERWKELCDAYGAEVVHLDVPWGERVEPQALADLLGALGRPPRAVFATQSESSTGVVNDVRALNEAVVAHGSLLCVDAISGLAAVDLPQDEWGVDVVVSGSQKSLMSPPGLAFASASERALALAAERPGPRYYFDWARAAAGQRETPANSPFTPAVTLFRALDMALELIATEGLERVLARHALLARAARAGIEALGLERFGPDDPNANVITAAAVPDGVDGAAVPKLMRDRYGVTAAGGQGQLKGKIVRIAHCGYYGAFDIVIALTALESALRDAGWDATPGAAAGAAQAVFAEAGAAPQPVG
jgi:aspartate aminotransferase-like enzyme